MIRRIGTLLAIVAGVSLATLPTLSISGATHTAGSCMYSDVKAKVDAAGVGDTVVIPPGDCTWTQALHINKGITLQGSGTSSTIIRDNVPKNGAPTSGILYVTVNYPQNFRLTNFSVVAVSADTNKFNKGAIYAYGTAKAFRIDHLAYSGNVYS